ncbi:MAG: PKD domain-containing protein [Oligoflexia bacterium]|nr:PKD domain-containing protein [Oligoflexia bacterium]
MNQIKQTLAQLTTSSFITLLFIISTISLSLYSCKPVISVPVPTAGFTASQDSSSYKVTFDASTSKSNSTSIIKYQWNFGDGQNATVTTAITNHTYASSGTYKITLTVTNDQNKDGSAQAQITLATIITPTPIPTGTPDPNNRVNKWSATNLPINLRVSNAFNSSEIALVTTSANTWEAGANNLNFFNVNATTVANKTFSTIYDYLNDTEMGIYKSTAWFVGEPSQTLAICVFEGYLINKDTADEYLRLINFDIVFNYRDHQFRTTDTPSGGKIDFLSVLLHEMGHSLGLNHSAPSFTDSIMKPSVTALENIHSLSPLDQDNIENLYADLITSPAALILDGTNNNNNDNDGSVNSTEDSTPPANGVLIRGYRSLQLDGTIKTKFLNRNH